MRKIYVSVIAMVGLMISAHTMAADMPELAKQGNYCAECHKIDTKSLGPSWMDISKFYNGKSDKTSSGIKLQDATGGMPVDQFLIKKVSVGGHGNWGAQPMLANDYVYHQTTPVKQAQITELVKYVLSLAK